MKKLSTDKFLSKVQMIIHRFPLAILFSLLLTGKQLYNTSNNLYVEDPLYLTLILGFLLSISSQFLYEILIDKESKLNYFLMKIGVLFTAGLYYILLSKQVSLVDNPSNILYSIPGIRTLILYFISVLLLIWIPTIKKKISFSEQFINIFRSFFTTVFFSLILFLGTQVILGLFQFLFFTPSDYWWSYPGDIIANLFMPVFFLTLLPDFNVKSKENKLSLFLYNLINYIFVPVSTIMTGIILVYILSNLTNDFFKESILETLILSYTISGWIILTLADSIHHKLSQWYKILFPISLIFMLSLQIVATFIQIQKVGLTHGRYLIILFGIGSIISALWYIFKKQNLQMLPIIALLSGVIALIPSIDAIGISVKQQVNRANSILEKNEILTDEGKIITNKSSTVPKKEQEDVMRSISYLSEISALNQLSWLPKIYYENPQEYLDFDVEIGMNYYNGSSENISLFLDEQDILLEINDFEVAYVMSLNMDSPTPEKNIIINDKEYQLEVIFDEELIVQLTSLKNEEIISFDFSYLFDEFKGTEQEYYEQEDLTFIENKEGLTVQLFIRSLIYEKDYKEGEFYIFIK